MEQISQEVIKAYALENAIKHEGKANQGAVLAGLFAEGLEKSEIKNYIPKIIKILEKVNAMPLPRQIEEFKGYESKISRREIRTGLPELENAKKGEVVMRLAPFPSGPLHIGNARTIILNDEYVKMYDGKLILVIDDTIGSVKKPIEPEAYKLIEEGIKWLGVNFDKKIIRKSDRIEKYYNYAEELIKKSYMYVCDCEQEKMRELKAKGIECSCRQRDEETNMEQWRKLFTAPEGSMCVRLKTGMQNPDPAFRDRIMFRISDRPHALLGTKYRVYPLLDFSWAIDDHLLGVTHILRGTDLVMETKVEKFIWDIFGWKHSEVVYNGFFEVEGVKISKSKGAQEVKSGHYSGWNDPRTWSLQSLQDRGIKSETVRKFIIDMGIKKTNVKIPVEVLYALNRKNLENVPRYFFIQNPEKITISASPNKTVEIPFNTSDPKNSRKFNINQEFYIPKEDYDLMQDTEYRLMHIFNFKTDKLFPLKPRTFSYISDEPTSEKKLKYMQWLPADAKNSKVEILMSNGEKISGIAEEEIENVKIGEVIFFERVGFIRCHKKDKGNLEFWFAHS
ncbi:glutamate--tRNA ligase [archaeon]|jgi:glutamyl-tRNA synthetase|nr:glutamate--tRNA ligase [archaeon]MBT6182531.1 glutamate--tRNA ligase [archaeon]MBT6606412.1 glutamate--tRNA ligase [archaeon]MBT7251419.1 glutamate--tRNA ligase [archaeon]MBT7660474.1 glutamate--tRNA ligase [archaeon]